MGGSTATRFSDRRRLLDPLVTAHVVLLEAPGGYGKTTLADQAAGAWEQVVVRARFTGPTSLGDALAELRRSARRAGLTDLVDATDPDAADDPSESLDRLVGAIAVRTDRVTVLLDDVQRLEPSAATELADALRELPSGCHVIVAGRELGPFAAWTSQPGAVRLVTGDLRLTRDEVAELLPPDAAPALVDEVLDATTGWCAAVVLAAARIDVDPSWSPVGAGGARSLMTDLVGEVVAEAPHLALLAQVPLIDPTVCELLGGAELVTAAAASGWLPAATAGWSTLPDPIAEVLGRGEPLDPVVRNQVVRHYRTRGEVAAAIGLAEGAVDDDALVELLADLHWTELAEQGAPTVKALLQRLDDDGPLRQHLRVLVTAAQSIELTDEALRADALARAVRLANEVGDEVTARAAVAEQGRDVITQEDIESTPATMAALLEAAGPDEDLTRGRALSALARVEVYACTPESLRAGAEHYAEAARLFEAAGEISWAAGVLARRGYTALFLAGRLDEGAEEVRRSIALLPSSDVTRGFWLTYYGDVLDVVGRATEADAAVAEALEIGHRRRDRSLVGMACWTQSWHTSRRRDLAGCRAAIAVAERELDGWGRAGQMVEFLASSAECFARLGDEAGSTEYRARARALATSADYEVPVDMADARHEAVFGDPAAALPLLAKFDDSAGVVPSSRPSRLVQLALARARLGELDAAADLAAEANREAASLGVPDLLVRTEGEIVERLAPLLAATGSGPTTSTDDESEDGSTAIQLHLLGRYAATSAAGDCTPYPGHPSTLVKLLALGGPLTTEGAIDALWPDADVSTGRARLRNLLNRLKGRSGEIVVRDGDSLRLGRTVEVDVDVFERQASDALSAPPDGRVGLARHALAVYAGELLPADRYEDWAAGPRERLKRRYLALVDLVAADAVQRGDADEAMRLLDLGIAVEPLDEARYRLLCDVLVARDRLGSAREVAARAVAALAEIGIEAHPDLTTLATGSSRP